MAALLLVTLTAGATHALLGHLYGIPETRCECGAARTKNHVCPRRAS